ncbi:MAG: hypothetical protein CM15mP84_09080 [Cellvibrionales bacterium]|nr:MAG: hypothetical protein CM15mP84_09080 [Cellvibrionales bacterium]
MQISKTTLTFQREFDLDLAHYVGRPSPLYEAARLSDAIGGGRIFLKREDLNHTGAHKVNNTIGQALLAKHMGKKRVIAETGAGQHGVASATWRHGWVWSAMFLWVKKTFAAISQRLPHEVAGSTGYFGDFGLAHLERRNERGDARLGDTYRRYVLHHWYGCRPASVSDAGESFQSVIGREARANHWHRMASSPTP